MEASTCAVKLRLVACPDGPFFLDYAFFALRADGRRAQDAEPFLVFQMKIEQDGDERRAGSKGVVHGFSGVCHRT